MSRDSAPRRIPGVAWYGPAMAAGNFDLRPDEAIAARVMLGVYGDGWTVDPQDIAGAPSSMHDFDLVSGSARVAVEVSTVADTLTMGHPMRWDRSFPAGASVVVGPAKGWIVTARAGGDPRQLKRRLGGWLASLEALGISGTQTVRWQSHAFESAMLRPPEFETLRQLDAVGVEIVTVAPELPAGKISILRIDTEFVWNVADEERFSEFVSDELQGNHLSDVAKVLAATADRRAVFLWLHATSHFDMVRRLDHGILGGSVYGAEDIDEVWIGRQMTNGRVLAYRWTDLDGWVGFVNNDLVAGWSEGAD